MITSLTQKTVDRLRPKAIYYRIADKDLPGLCVKVFPTGSKFYTLRYRRHKGDHIREHTLIPTHLLSLKEARDLARDRLSEIWLGQGLAVPAQAPAPYTLDQVIDLYIESRDFLNNRQSTQSQKNDLFRRFVRPILGTKDIEKISFRDIEAMMKQVAEQSGETTANMCRVFLKTVLGFATVRELVSRNAATGVKRFAMDGVRKRVLDPSEVATVFGLMKTAITDKPDVADILVLLLFTGQRRSEVSMMEWDEIDLATRLWVLPGVRTKNHRRHEVPLTDTCVQILAARKGPRTGRVFEPTANLVTYTSSQRLSAALAEPFTVHDLRRTMITTLQKLDSAITTDMLERIINHAHGTAAITHYAHHDFLEEKRRVLETWESFILTAV
jgi:integrase